MSTSSPWRKDFPLFEHYPDFHYLDTAATAQKPRSVVNAIKQCYEHEYAPVHRGLYDLASAASDRYEQARDRVAAFIHSKQSQHCIFTRSATESINMVAQGWAQSRLAAGDEVWVTDMEHHANYLPWQRACQQTGAVLKSIPVDQHGVLLHEQCEDLYSERVKIIALTHVSNVLGCVNPVEEIIARANNNGIPVLLDASQSVGHKPVNVQTLDCAFLVFSAHKMYGPNGVGVLYGKPEFLEQVEPPMLGGGMVDVVESGGSTWADLPQRLEAGSPNLCGVLGLEAAIDYLEHTGIETLSQHTLALTRHAVSRLSAYDEVVVHGSGASSFLDGEDEQAHSGIASFSIRGIHPHDIAQVAAEHQVGIRAGHHCCQPLMRALGVDSTARASFSFYNNHDDVDALCAAIESTLALFQPRGEVV